MSETGDNEPRSITFYQGEVIETVPKADYDALKAELEEQCSPLGAGGERELALKAKLAAAEAEIEQLQALHLERTKSAERWISERDQEREKVRILTEALEYAGGIKGVPADKVKIGGADSWKTTALHIALEALAKVRGRK